MFGIGVEIISFSDYILLKFAQNLVFRSDFTNDLKFRKNSHKICHNSNAYQTFSKKNSHKVFVLNLYFFENIYIFGNVLKKKE